MFSLQSSEIAGLPDESSLLLSSGEQNYRATFDSFADQVLKAMEGEDQVLDQHEPPQTHKPNN